MIKYLYLTEVDWVRAWILGGSIPISLASSYLSNHREGILTVDENLIHKGPYSNRLYKHFGYSFRECKNILFTDNYSNGVKLPDGDLSHYHEDGAILSFCNNYDLSIAKRMRKSACVKILNINRLKKIIDQQVAVKSIMKACEYTNDHKRDHFLKSIEDSWQNEYRIFWPTKSKLNVTLPKGIAEIVWTE